MEEIMIENYESSKKRKQKRMLETWTITEQKELTPHYHVSSDIEQTIVISLDKNDGGTI